MNGSASAAKGPASAAVLAIDAGNSKTDVAVVAADGSVVGSARGGGFQPPKVGVEAAVDVLADAVLRAFADAGLPADAQVEHVSACLANADLPVEEEQLAAALQARGWGVSTVVLNDTFAVLRAGLVEDAEPRGVAVVCGAGINCAGMLPDGRTARFPAIGKLSGDWGGGSGLAEEALWYAARAEDGRGEATELAAALPAHFGLDSMYALIEAFHLGHLESPRRHELTPVLFATAAGGDAVAGAIVERMAEEVVVMSTVALGKLGLLSEEVPVLLGGGILAAGHPRLNHRVRELLARRAPMAVARVVTARPVLGAALLGLDHLSLETSAHARARAHYETAAPAAVPSEGAPVG
ncbi:ATPase [Streptomyces tsukubensis]|uniref:ATPase n=1 Tax=Streptomyces tsukubensis TaxID=83656 RepID=A0A1V4ABQ8_9ACTN|nr:BadF/BadG/BcrA/BcrD ATPase family protein [Streptomyces tsukubensis]OON80946.1 ATPase [Streptomyces tsukubensis]QFR93607.1 ATPase [Streptomyces tsukubensis]